MESGAHFDFANPRENDISIEDIALGLSREPRFVGQTNKRLAPYTVAQHSVMVSYIVDEQFALEGLMHDAHEAFVRDLPLPFKMILPGYREIERRVDRVIRKKFNLPEFMSAEVKLADLILLATEKRDLLPNESRPWPRAAGSFSAGIPHRSA